MTTASGATPSGLSRSSARVSNRSPPRALGPAPPRPFPPAAPQPTRRIAWRRLARVTDTGEDGARLGGILGDLRLQRVEPGEFALRPDEVDQGDPEMPPVEIGINVEEMHLE